jgi:hypothetical protein
MTAWTLPIVLEELSGVRKRPMIRSMPTMGRPQQRYDHRLRHLVHRTGDVTVATDLGVPRSTARGWLEAAPTVVVCLDGADLTEPELRQELLKLRRRVQKLTALLRLALALLRTSGFRLTEERLPDGRAKMRILRAVDRAREFVPLRALLRFLRLSPSRFHAWRRRQRACALEDQSSCPRTTPSRLTPREVRAIQDMVTSPEYRHVPTGTLAVQVDDLISTGVLRRVLALTELKFSNSMIEAWWRSLKHQWLFLHSLDSIATVHRLVAFYVAEHNRVLPHSEFRGQTPDEMYFGTGDAVPADLMARAGAARRARGEANRSASCETCSSVDAAA